MSTAGRRRPRDYLVTLEGKPHIKWSVYFVRCTPADSRSDFPAQREGFVELTLPEDATYNLLRAHIESDPRLKDKVPGWELLLLRDYVELSEKTFHLLVKSILAEKDVPELEIREPGSSYGAVESMLRIATS